MTKERDNNQEEEQELAQPYDTTFKDWIRQQPRDILPVLLPGAIYEDTLDVEIARPTMRTDKVFCWIEPPPSVYERKQLYERS